MNVLNVQNCLEIQYTFDVKLKDRLPENTEVPKIKNARNRCLKSCYKRFFIVQKTVFAKKYIF